MSTSKAIELLFMCIPAIVVGVLAYFLFKDFLKNEDKRRRFLLIKDIQKDILPMRLQAYERMTLFLERIVPSKLLLRVAPIGDDKVAYAQLLIHHIEQEFEHNLTQQVYVSKDCWSAINNVKNILIQDIRQTVVQPDVINAQSLRESILKTYTEKELPNQLALDFIKEEVSSVFN